MSYQIKTQGGQTATLQQDPTGRWEMVLQSGYVVKLDDDEAYAEVKKSMGAQAARQMFPMVGFHA